MLKKINFLHYKKTFSIETKVCNSLQKIFGLMFRNREKANALLFEFKKPTKIKIHSVFVSFPFVAIWLDSEGKIINLKTVRPFKFSVGPKQEFSKLIEIPINKKYSKLVEDLCRHTDG